MKGLKTRLEQRYMRCLLYGQRYRKDDDERDISPEIFHKLLTHYLK